MRKIQKAAVVAAMLGSVGFLGAGVGHAGEGPSVKLDNEQSTSCESNESSTGFGGLVNVSDVLNDNAIAVLGQASASHDTAQECNAVFGLGG
ncbi:hypothetical protein ACIGO6_01690 [Streptomyces sp. NPDC053750]|uniref:hypothetical protein n=1 Tax=Streptomyces sp. NPDC053750 TaxID=3365714 RepID=UPI0037D53057